MSVLRKVKICKLPSVKYFSSTLYNESEYTSTPQYPPILDLSFEKRLNRKKQAVYDEIKTVKTVEEKQIKLNMPRYYGFKTLLYSDDKIYYNNLPLAQHITRTHLITDDNLPEFYKSINVDEHINDLKSELEEVILMELEGYRKKHDLRKEKLKESEIDNFFSFTFSRQLNRILINKLNKKYQHLADIHVDLNPRIETSWAVGGFIPPKSVKKFRESQEWMKDFINEPVDRIVGYIGSPNLMVRSKLPLKLIVPPSEAENPDFIIPLIKHDPMAIGARAEHRFMANVPGFWPGDKYQFGLISSYKRGHLFTRQRFQDKQDDKEALHTQGLTASFGWLAAQANLLGFTTYNDITYPLVTQTIITNGKTFSFYVYQMNTMLMHGKNVNENPKKNICWATNEMNLYEDFVDGKLVGFNEDVVKKLVKIYANSPEERLGINMRPYLNSQEKLIADYEDDDKRRWLEQEYKFLVSNRPRHKEIDEIYSWEKIYKVDHQTRFQEKRTRFFELGINPAKRTLDNRKPYYIPRALRPHLPRWKGRDAKEYFP